MARLRIQQPFDPGDPASGQTLYVVVTLAAALLLNLLPLAGWVLALRPRFRRPHVLYWGSTSRARSGSLPAWLLGLAVDVAEGQPVRPARAGLRAVMMFSAFALHRRVAMFGVRQQIPHVLVILLLMQVIVLGGAGGGGGASTRAGGISCPALSCAVVAGNPVLFHDSRCARAGSSTTSKASAAHAPGDVPPSRGEPCSRASRPSTRAQQLPTATGDRRRRRAVRLLCPVRGRFFYVQVIQHDYYHTRPSRNRIFNRPGGAQNAGG